MPGVLIFNPGCPLGGSSKVRYIAKFYLSNLPKSPPLPYIKYWYTEFMDKKIHISRTTDLENDIQCTKDLSYTCLGRSHGPFGTDPFKSIIEPIYYIYHSLLPYY